MSQPNGVDLVVTLVDAADHVENCFQSNRKPFCGKPPMATLLKRDTPVQCQTDSDD